jgi:transglutaminase superfamily protein
MRIICRRIFLVLFACLVCGCGLRPTPSQETTDTGEVTRTFQRVLQDRSNPKAGDEVKELARALGSSAQSDRQKAYSIYRWLGENISYNVEGLYSGDLGDNSPDAVYRSRTAVCAGYANLFQVMCEEVGLESKIVPGRSRASGNELPPSLRDSDSNHAWNAVKIDGDWQLLDPTWGAGHVTDEKEFVRDPNDDWFLVDPKVFAFSHLPADPEWQLTSTTLTLEDFQSQPEMKPRFFNSGLELIEPLTGRLECNGEARFRVRNEGRYVVSGVAMQNGDWLPPETSFRRVVGDETLIDVRFPRPGSYEVHLMVSLPEEDTAESVAQFEVEAVRANTDVFPETFLTYKEHGCDLIEPDTGMLRAGREARFVVRIPDAEKAVLSNGGNMVAMEKAGDTFSLVHAPTKGELMIMGAFDQSNKVWSVLKYTVE